MKEKIYSIIIAGLMLITGVLSISSQVLAGPVEPPLQSLPVDSDGPWEGWYGEDVYFTGYTWGGTPPYYYKWSFGDGYSTDWSLDNTATHKYYPTVSPTRYQVTLNVKDSGQPRYRVGTLISFADISIEYDIHVLNLLMDKEFFSWREPITGTAYIENMEHYHICPYYTIEVWIIGYKPWSRTYTRTNLPPGGINSIHFSLTNPGTQILPYLVKVEIIDWGDYDQSLIDHSQISLPFWVI